MRFLRAALLPAAVALVLWAAWTVPLPLFVERPGELVSLGSQVEVGLDAPTDIDGDFLLTVANLRRATTAVALRGLFDDDAVFLRQERLIPPGVDDEAYFARQRDVFREAADVAAAVGLRAAGHPVDPDDVVGDGVVVLGVVPGLPADGVLEPGDIVTTVDGEPVGTNRELHELITGAGTRPLHLGFLRDGRERSVRLTPERRATGGEVRPMLGLEIRTLRPRIRLPVPVDVAGGRIGGPSAGLLVALTVYDKAAADVDLAAGRRVAGTGGLARDGTVETVGGIAAKVVAAHRAGADVFLVPAGQEATAREALPGGSAMEVVAVGSFDEAVAALRGAAAWTASLHWPIPLLASPGGRR